MKFGSRSRHEKHLDSFDSLVVDFLVSIHSHTTRLRVLAFEFIYDLSSTVLCMVSSVQYVFELRPAVEGS